MAWHRPRHKVLERDIQKPIVQLLELLWKQDKLEYVRVNPTRPVTRKGKTFFVPLPESQKGPPDLIVFPKHSTEVWLIETKSPTGKASTHQERWAELSIKSQIRYFRPHTIVEAHNLIDWIMEQI